MVPYPLRVRIHVNWIRGTREDNMWKVRKKKNLNPRANFIGSWKEWDTWCIGRDRGQAERSRRVEHNSCFKTKGNDG